MSRPVTDTGTGTRRGTRTRRKAVTKTRTKKRTISLLWKSVLLRHELNRVKAAGHAEEATFAVGCSTLQAVTAMSRLFNTASAVVQVRVLGGSALTWQQWAVLHETKWVRRQYGRPAAVRLQCCPQQLMCQLSGRPDFPMFISCTGWARFS